MHFYSTPTRPHLCPSPRPWPFPPFPPRACARTRANLAAPFPAPYTRACGQINLMLLGGLLHQECRSFCPENAPTDSWQLRFAHRSHLSASAGRLPTPPSFTPLPHPSDPLRTEAHHHRPQPRAHPQTCRVAALTVCAVGITYNCAGGDDAPASPGGGGSGQRRCARCVPASLRLPLGR